MNFIKNMVIASVAAGVAASTGTAWATTPTQSPPGVATPAQCVRGDGQVQGDKCAGGRFPDAHIGGASTYVITANGCTSGGGHLEGPWCEGGHTDDYLIRG